MGSTTPPHASDGRTGAIVEQMAIRQLGERVAVGTPLKLVTEDSLFIRSVQHPAGREITDRPRISLSNQALDRTPTRITRRKQGSAWLLGICDRPAERLKSLRRAEATWSERKSRVPSLTICASVTAFASKSNGTRRRSAVTWRKLQRASAGLTLSHPGGERTRKSLIGRICLRYRTIRARLISGQA
jgi:hypothetical protein